MCLYDLFDIKFYCTTSEVKGLLQRRFIKNTLLMVYVVSVLIVQWVGLQVGDDLG